jgi:hypothetical protein
VNEILALLLGAGGAGGLAGLVNVYLSFRDKSGAREETLIQRLNSESKKQQERADEAEKDSDLLRQQRDRARELVVQYRGRLIALGEQLPPIDDLYL